MEEESLFDLEGLNLDEYEETEEQEVIKESEPEEESANEPSEEDNEGEPASEEVEEESTEEDPVEEPVEEEEEETSPLYETLTSFVEKGILDELDEEFDSEEGALEALINKKVETTKKEAVDEYVNSLPEEVKGYIDVAKKGGDIDKLRELESLPDFKNIELTEKNQELLVEDALRMTTTFSEDQIKAKIERYKSSGNIQDEAEEAREILAAYKEKEISSYKEKVEQEAKLVEEKKIEEQKKFEDKVTNLTELNGFNVSKKDAKSLHDYIIKPVGPNGESQYVLDDSDKEDYRLLIPFLMMKGFDKDSLEKKARSKALVKINKKLKNQNDINARPNKSAEHGRVENGDISDISWNF